MEGMGSNIIETLGGEKGVTPNLSKYTKEGIVFTNFFANAIRTDRGLTSILSAYPAQPTNSVMKDSKKIQNIPIITQNFKAAGYETAFYYGGDDNFTNLRSYLITAGYQTIINEKNFDGNEISTKWGAYDHILFQKIKKDLNQKRLENRLNSPLFYTILTLNSHEPFDVPINVLEDRYLNSAYYADSCIGDFIETVRNSELWENSLIVILPDHSFRYPYNLSNSEPYRYRIPLIWLGGAIKEQPMEVEKTCGQVDLAATLLNQLDMEHADFVFSHDIFTPLHPQYAFFSYPDGFGFINKTDTALYDCGANKTIRTTNEKTLQQGKAYLQKLYDDLSKR
jgi:phosphoglycerol transferase MdoB-like AlkP superfamily enzyme